MKVIWLPLSYRAGISIADDPDNGTFKAFRKIYDLLLDLNFPTTRAMWVYPNEQKTGIPNLNVSFFAPLLTEKKCLEYCKKLNEHGFEICLHGASCGNNSREKTIEALKYLENNISGCTSYICHSKNAENLYWDTKVAHSKILKYLLGFYTSNHCFGEISCSPYFWGDICRERIKYIRLFRTRNLNTLSFNPSMPYHIFDKPYVNYWYSATKGYIPNLLRPENLEMLCEENGLGILYQYMHKYVNNSNEINPAVKESLIRVADHSGILIKPVSWMLDRLKQFQLLFSIDNNGETYLINASKNAIKSIQIDVERTDKFHVSVPFTIDKAKSIVIIHEMKPFSVIRINREEKNNSSRFYSSKVIDNIARINFKCGVVIANLSSHSISLKQSATDLYYNYFGIDTLNGHEVKVYYNDPDAERLEILNPISNGELFKLFIGQSKILLREHIILRRKVSTAKYLENSGKAEDLANW